MLPVTKELEYARNQPPVSWAATRLGKCRCRAQPHGTAHATAGQTHDGGRRAPSCGCGEDAKGRHAISPVTLGAPTSTDTTHRSGARAPNRRSERPGTGGGGWLSVWARAGCSGVGSLGREHEATHRARTQTQTQTQRSHEGLTAKRKDVSTVVIVLAHRGRAAAGGDQDPGPTSVRLGARMPALYNWAGVCMPSIPFFPI